MLALSAEYICEICGGPSQIGKRRRWVETPSGFRLTTLPCTHVEDDRHRRQEIFSREAREGWVFLAEPLFGDPVIFHPQSGELRPNLKKSAMRRATGTAVEFWSRSAVKRRWIHQWVRTHYSVAPVDPMNDDGETASGSWFRLDVLEENIGAMREWAKRYDALMKTNFSHCIHVVAGCVAAGRKVQHAAMPWWRASQETPILMNRRRYWLASQLPAWLAG